MNTNENNDYDPSGDENQGVVTKLAQGEEANNGVSQIEYMNPVFNQGPEPVKEEVNNRDDRSAGAGPLDSEANGINDDMLAEEDVENGDVEVNE
jgi:hypothetical protein